MNEGLTVYQPDKVLTDRKEANRAKNTGPLTVDKPVSFRVMKTRPPTQRKHYPRKARRRAAVDQFDPRNVRYF